MRGIQAKARAGVIAGALTLALVGAEPAPTWAISYAPVDRPGPALSIPAPELASSLRCHGDLGAAARTPVLIVPPTLIDPDEAFFGYERAFTAMGVPYCTVTIPHFTTQDIQLSGEFVVNAIRRMYAMTGRRLKVLGWSQGAGPEPRWALRFWPDVRAMVDDLVGLEAPNHGSVGARAVCQGSCVPALWQQADGTNFIKALNSGQETFPGISYTNVYSRTSQFVQPNLDDSGTTSLHGPGQIANVATQDICPTNAADHLAYYYDPVAYALTIDALNHAGPADPSRIDTASLCTQTSMPFVPFSDVPAYSARLSNTLFVDRFRNQPQTSGEPPLRCYVTASCAAASAAQGKQCTSRRRFTIHLPGSLRSARVSYAGRTATAVRSRGRLRVLIDLRGLRRTRIVVSVVGRTRGGGAVRELRVYRTCARHRLRPS
jgi:hypothetical protein